jgi:exopolyphosphatase / guanosine-5'-triphosphate,3'-diphosphate pyrophosphatase
LTEAVHQSCGLEMEVLSGDKEADWVFRGVTTSPKLAQSPVLILDVGGGSTEIIVGDHAVPQFRSSYSLGTVRLLEQLRRTIRRDCGRCSGAASGCVIF